MSVLETRASREQGRDEPVETETSSVTVGENPGGSALGVEGEVTDGPDKLVEEGDEVDGI